MRKAAVRDGKSATRDHGLFGKTGLTRNEQRSISGAMALGRRYLFDECHGLQAAKLSVALFDQLADLHRLGRDERCLLFAAGILHDIGMFVSCRSHHKHSMRIISGSDIPGFTRRQIRIIANIARYHRKGVPSLKHGAFSRLKKKERMLVKTLAAILRIGDALDRDHRQEVVSISAQVRPSTVLLRFAGKAMLPSDRPAFRKKANLFEKLFKLRIILSGESAL